MLLCPVLCCVVLLCCVVFCRSCLESIFGRFGGVLDRFRVVLDGSLGGLFGVLEGLGWLLEGSWRVLGPSWISLGPSWVVRVVFGSTRSAEASHLDRFWVPKGGQDEAKIGAKRDQNRRQKRCQKKMLLKIVLEPSWVDLGSSWVPSWVSFFDFGWGFTMVFEQSHF